MNNRTIIMALPDEPTPLAHNLQRKLDEMRADMLDQACDELQALINGQRELAARLRAGLQ